MPRQRGSDDFDAHEPPPRRQVIDPAPNALDQLHTFSIPDDEALTWWDDYLNDAVGTDRTRRDNSEWPFEDHEPHEMPRCDDCSRRPPGPNNIYDFAACCLCGKFYDDVAQEVELGSERGAWPFPWCCFCMCTCEERYSGSDEDDSLYVPSQAGSDDDSSGESDGSSSSASAPSASSLVTSSPSASASSASASSHSSTSSTYHAEHHQLASRERESLWAPITVDEYMDLLDQDMSPAELRLMLPGVYAIQDLTNTFTGHLEAHQIEMRFPEIAFYRSNGNYGPRRPHNNSIDNDNGSMDIDDQDDLLPPDQISIPDTLPASPRGGGGRVNNVPTHTTCLVCSRPYPPAVLTRRLGTYTGPLPQLCETCWLPMLNTGGAGYCDCMCSCSPSGSEPDLQPPDHSYFAQWAQSWGGQAPNPADNHHHNGHVVLPWTQANNDRLNNANLDGAGDMDVIMMHAVIQNDTTTVISTRSATRQHEEHEAREDGQNGRRVRMRRSARLMDRDSTRRRGGGGDGGRRRGRGGQ